MKRRTFTGPRLGTYRGEPAVFMPLQDGTEAVTTPEGYARVLAAACPGAWTLNSNGSRARFYVRVTEAGGFGNRDRLRSVAALISGVSTHRRTTFINGNRLDLRPCNLRTTAPSLRSVRRTGGAPQ